jgi:hypothetical protein
MDVPSGPPPPMEGGPPAFDVEFHSSNARVDRVLDRYRGQTKSSRDIAMIEVFVHFDGLTRPLLVPNPRVHRKNVAVVWQHDVKKALGLQGALSDMWLKPLALKMIQAPSMRAAPRQKRRADVLHFEPSSAHDSNPIIWAAYLETGAVYEVTMEDRREDALRRLTDEQRQHIADSFRAFDEDDSGAVSRVELEAHIRSRNEVRRRKIDEQCAGYKRDNPDRADEADAMHAEHLAKIQEAEEKMVLMFNSADIDGNGLLSWTEYSLAEAHWLSSSINPDKVNLFD